MDIIYHFRVKGVGPERVHISGIAGAFEKLGHSVTFVSPTDVNPLKAGDVAPQKGGLRSLLYFFADKTPQVCFECMEILYNLMAFKKLTKEIAKVKPTFIYERYSFFCFAGIYLAKKYRIPIILEVNEVGGFDRVRPQKLVALSKVFEKYVFSNANVVITVSDFLKDQIIARGGVKENMLVVPNGIDPLLFSQIVHSTTLKDILGLSDHTIIGFVGYLVHWHRLDLLLHAFAKVIKVYPNVKLLLIGDGVLKEELVKLSIELEIDRSLVITGRVDHSEIPNYIDAIDIAIIPNSNEYRSPIKMFEYMAMGKAIIAPDQPPILEVLENGKTGFIFKNGDGNDLFTKIQTALSNKQMCNSVGLNAKYLVVNDFTWDIHATKIIQFLLDKSGNETESVARI